MKTAFSGVPVAPFRKFIGFPTDTNALDYDASRNVIAAGSFAKYDASRRAPFVAMLERVGAFPIPNEMIAIVCAFWLRAGEYYGGSDADARGENLENLRAMLAESDDDEELPS